MLSPAGMLLRGLHQEANPHIMSLVRNGPVRDWQTRVLATGIKYWRTFRWHLLPGGMRCDARFGHTLGIAAAWPPPTTLAQARARPPYLGSPLFLLPKRHVSAAGSGGAAPAAPRAALLAIGDELLRGSIADVNTPWLAKLLYRRV